MIARTRAKAAQRMRKLVNDSVDAAFVRAVAVEIGIGVSTLYRYLARQK
jgi:hypothetical protein